MHENRKENTADPIFRSSKDTICVKNWCKTEDMNPLLSLQLVPCCFVQLNKSVSLDEFFWNSSNDFGCLYEATAAFDFQGSDSQVENILIRHPRIKAFHKQLRKNPALSFGLLCLTECVSTCQINEKYERTNRPLTYSQTIAMHSMTVWQCKTWI